MSSPSSLAAIRVGLALGKDRVLRRPTMMSCLLGAALVTTLGAVEHHYAASSAVDRTLAGTFRLVIPLVCFGVAAEASSRTSLRTSGWCAARFGAHPRGVALGIAGAAGVASSAISAVYAFFAVMLTHHRGDGSGIGDAMTSLWIGALVGAAYAAWFMVGATFGRRGSGRWVPLFLDLLLGGLTSLAAAVLPHVHATNLLGLPTRLPLTQPASTAILLGSTVFLMLLAALRSA